MTNGKVSRYDAGLLVLRLLVGILLLSHGITKVRGGVGWLEGMLSEHGIPTIFAYLVYLGEVVGPLLIIFGFWFRVGTLLVAANMLVAILLARRDVMFTLNQAGAPAVELELFYLFCAIALFLIGPGRYRLANG